MVKLPWPCQCQFPTPVQFFIPVPNCRGWYSVWLIGVLFYSYNSDNNKSEKNGESEKEERDPRVVVMMVYRGEGRRRRRKWKEHCTK